MRRADYYAANRDAEVHTTPRAWAESDLQLDRVDSAKVHAHPHSDECTEDCTVIERVQPARVISIP